MRKQNYNDAGQPLRSTSLPLKADSRIRSKKESNRFSFDRKRLHKRKRRKKEGLHVDWDSGHKQAPCLTSLPTRKATSMAVT